MISQESEKSLSRGSHRGSPDDGHRSNTGLPPAHQFNSPEVKRRVQQVILSQHRLFNQNKKLRQSSRNFEAVRSSYESEGKFDRTGSTAEL